MIRQPALGGAATRAIAHVTDKSVGEPLAPGARVSVHFHPDRAYDEAPAHRRPVYGALDTVGWPYGAAPRFGSSFLRLAAPTLSRCTFCYPDSVFEPTAFGVAARCDLPDRAARDTVDDPLDAHVEAHLHGPLRLVDDVEALVLDPSFRGTSVEREARRWPCPVEWHPGFRLAPSELERCSDYRGPAVTELARRISGGETLTPADLGRAVSTDRRDPTSLKRLWHCLARFGQCG